jgi:hypothetical protein
MSPRSAAYRLDCPASDRDCSQAIAALKSHPTVRYLTIDQKKDFR